MIRTDEILRKAEVKAVVEGKEELVDFCHLVFRCGEKGKSWLVLRLPTKNIYQEQ